MTIFLTGGTGLLGSNIVKELIKDEYQVKVLARSHAKGERIKGKGVELVQGDLKDIGGFAEALAGCDLLIHAGAYFTEFFKKGNEGNPLYKINVNGTEKLFEEAYKKGITNIIYISSTGVLDSSGPDIVTEKAPYVDNTNPYFESKIQAEKKIREFIDRYPEMRVVTILPAIMMGPGDYGPTRMGEFVLSFLNEKMPAILPVKAVIVDARDVARAVVSAIDKGKNGERYIVGGNVYEMKEIVSMLSDVSGIPMPKKQPPFGMVMILSGIMALISKVTGKSSPIPRRDELRKMRVQKGYSYEKAKKELGITFRPLQETITDTVNWFSENR
ncbi:Nucleoside-diphosphate-sugar epimerase [Natronincola peptidivorans]|uniref:Nucleoside-diphosphate-sugar epimerase n=1 Tax=Natronincola peptidivorans TaxID=426128 RepID=A0A1I0AUH0_9FIRM|nr:NAD-dependent epimerase/dehydratase family protein [Natronincola peptidivorans]SES98022.1 Nucleoside-diphosphate-sugar epimerase [Natronincola peptidivorans]